jgi:hypothetical protein
MRQTVFYSALAVAACLALIAGCETSDRVDGYPAGTNSFAQGTLVRTSDGHVPIETLEVGDLVQSFDPVSGEWSDRAVIAVRAREAREELVSIQLGNSRIDGTAGHVVFLAATGEQTGQLPVALRGDAVLIRLAGIPAGDLLQAAAGPVVVREAARKTVQTVLYSLLVEGNHTYAVTEDSLAVGDASIKITARPWHRLPREADLRAGGACFPAGTPVRTPDGLVSLDDLRIGDAVRTAHPLSGSQVTSRITGLSQQEYEGDMVTIRVDDEDVTSTGNHPFWVSSGKDLDRRPDPSDVPAAERGFTSGGRWVEARALRPGDTLGTIGGRNATIERVTTGIVTTSVYNITVDSVHTYAVSAGGYLVHNKGGMQAERAAPPTLSAEPAAE